MEFSLLYRGALTAARTGRRDEKHALRRHFHMQLRQLWNQPPLDASEGLWNPNHQHYNKDADIKLQTSGYEIVPLCCAKTSQVADLDIQLIRPGAFGINRSHAGDIDNRLKIVLDALRMPQDRAELPDGAKPQGEESPFFCLLEDDSLIHDLSVHTHRWLEVGVAPDEVLMLIKIRTLSIRDMAWDPFGSWTV